MPSGHRKTCSVSQSNDMFWRHHFHQISFTPMIFCRSQSPVYVRKSSRSFLTSLTIKESRNLGSLTCHVLRDASQPVFDHFMANSSTRYDLISEVTCINKTCTLPTTGSDRLGPTTPTPLANPPSTLRTVISTSETTRLLKALWIWKSSSFYSRSWVEMAKMSAT